jgi:hypothetical protein
MTHRLLIFSVLLAAASGPQAQAEDCAVPFKLVSWNIQTFGEVSGDRQKVIKSAYASVFSTSVFVFAAQEIANADGLALFSRLLPGGTWQASFEDTPDSQDNGIFFRIDRATITSQGFLFVDPKTGKPEKSKAVHPVRWAHVRVNDFDFMLLSLHLTFKGGDARASKTELFALLDWVKDYLKSPKHDPDVVIAGDFNLPSEKGKLFSQRAKDNKWLPINAMIREHGAFADDPNKLLVLIDEPTSRPNKKPANNYDHFIVTQSAYKKLLRHSRSPISLIDKFDAKKPGRISDHYPIEAVFCSKGKGIKLDGK